MMSLAGQDTMERPLGVAVTTWTSGTAAESDVRNIGDMTLRTHNVVGLQLCCGGVGPAVSVAVITVQEGPQLWVQAAVRISAAALVLECLVLLVFMLDCTPKGPGNGAGTTWQVKVPSKRTQGLAGEAFDDPETS
ncbi:hypothetical protein NDU88_005732 [Pleurodeles waltl]|uniref:Uncharacterized protein n=1 Tax=Pleurodeles waltl TaxID=8319 RepID=A0AAV7SMG5_PLEWA|nr:hypothetical protein NDU88_005732 [Pleurodeles waltl]